MQLKLSSVLIFIFTFSVLALGLTWNDHEAESRADIDLRHFSNMMQNRFGGSRVRMVQNWEIMLREAASNGNDRAKLEIVNNFVHRNIRYRVDSDLYAASDYWASPLETLGYGAGDCEDWAILQYISLRIAGVSDEKLRLIYVNFRRGGPRSSITEAHMVLGYYATPTSEPIILDNLVSQIRPASQRQDLTPVFSFNSEGLWAGNSASPAASSTARLSRWRNALENIRQEGVRL